MDTSSPDLGQHRPESFDHIGIFLPAGDEPRTPLLAGYGRCSQCNCPAYAGQQETCGNCGHNYAAHW
jgi:hypothetical protein